MVENGNTYELNGEIAKYSGTEPIEDLGFNPPTENLFVVKVTVDGADANATVKLTGEHSTKNITKSDFDGEDFVYLILDGNTKTYTIECKASEDELPVTLTIDNKATIGA